MSGSGNWFGKTECTNNANLLKQFYLNVLKQFTERLRKENRFKANGLDEDTCDRIEKLAKENINNPQKMFEKAITLKEGSSRLEDIIKNEQSNDIEISLLKIEHVDEKDDYFAVPVKNRSASHLPDQEREEDEYVDDLAGFQVDHENHKKSEEKKAIEVEVKKQDNDNVQYQPKQVKAEEDSEEEVDKTELTIQQCEESMSSIIMGTFSANSLKHKPKQEKTLIELDNVFVKWQGGETIYGHLSMEASKMQKEAIRKEFPYKPKDRAQSS